MAPKADNRVGFAVVCSLSLALVVGTAAGALAEMPTFDYLHIAANEGGSSGGHVAVRFEDWTYHFQRSENGLLRIHRDDSDSFRHRYAVLGNRAIRAHRVRVDGETYERLRTRFNTLYLAELKRSTTLRSLEADERLFAGLGGKSETRIEIRGSGYFYPSITSGDSTGVEEPSIAALRRRIKRTHGSRFLELRMREVDKAIRDLNPASFAGMSANADPSNPVPFYGFSARYLDLLTARTALEVLRTAPLLREDSYRHLQGAQFDVNSAEVGKLRAVSDRLAGELDRLADSPRPDWGYPFLVGAARLAAIRKSIESHSLVVLDAYESNTSIVDAESLDRRGVGVHRPLLDELRATYQSALARLVRAKEPGEAIYVRLEEAANRLDELEIALEKKESVRVSREALIPARLGPAVLAPRPDARDSDFERAYHNARDSRSAYLQALRRDHGYNLVARNCASEIFRTINAAMGSKPKEESKLRLGGYIDPDSELMFVPFISADAVRKEYNVIETTETPAYRRARLREMYAQENDILVYLREFNTLTSTVYSRNLDDSAFFAFTDDVIIARPLLGAMNVATGLGRSVWGIVRAPFDRGETFIGGLLGTMYSLPELAFVNIRKGSQYYIAPEYRSFVSEQSVVVEN